MIYKQHLIQARVETWDNYELNDDGTLGYFITNGGGDTDYPLYDVWTRDEDGEADQCLGDEFNTIEEAKAFIDDETAKGKDLVAA
jgi:hypothetical protein